MVENGFAFDPKKTLPRDPKNSGGPPPYVFPRSSHPTHSAPTVPFRGSFLAVSLPLSANLAMAPLGVAFEAWPPVLLYISSEVHGPPLVSLGKIWRKPVVCGKYGIWLKRYTSFTPKSPDCELPKLWRQGSVSSTRMLTCSWQDWDTVRCLLGIVQG